MNKDQNRRILLVDDMPSIHEDFRKILSSSPAFADLDEVEAVLFGTQTQESSSICFKMDSAYQGQEALAMVCASLQANQPYAMAFMDMRMPPGWDGLETIEHIWQQDPQIQIVICTAYSDYSWDEVLKRLDVRDRLLILKKPFDAAEVYQLASALTTKWEMTRQAAIKMGALEEQVQHRTAELSKSNQALQEEIVVRMKAEAELKLAASVFHNTNDGIMIIDAAVRIISVNPAFTVITGYSPEEVIGQTPSLLRSDRDKPGFDQELLDILECEGQPQEEIWHQHKNGEAFLARLSFGIVTEDDGKPLRYIIIFSDVTELRRKDESIRHLAFHDSLTGLPNRSLLLDRLEYAIKIVQREQSSLGLMFLDLDRFKSINDSLGHFMGDNLLKEVARRLTSCLRKSDVVARMGGDEFVILLKNVEMPEGYANVAQKIIDTIFLPLQLGDQPIQMNVSIGIACFPEDGVDSVELMKHADAAMYAAKTVGRGTYRFFQARMSEKVGQRLQLEMELRNAVQNGELELFYQPQISFSTNKVCGLEALVRWHHPVRGLMLPIDFIPLAEETGIIITLGNWVIEEACRQSRVWQNQGLEKIKIAVNVSAKQLQQGNLAENIAKIVRHYDLLPSSLEIELTESVLMDNPEKISSLLTRLREMGITVAIDDFGTGYSSLAYLRRLPIDVLKIDRSFIMRVDCNDGDDEIVKIIIGLGRALNLTIVAEGVETESQAIFLKSCACSIAQGHLYSRPQTAADIAVWLQRRC